VFWRSPTTGRGRGSDWPRTDALLRGEVVDHGRRVGEAKTNVWLHATEIQQPGQPWKKVSSDNCWMPFEIQSFVLVEQ
jgi:hypothetical protein